MASAVIVAENITHKYLVYCYYAYNNNIGQSNVINSKSCKGGGLRRRPPCGRSIRGLMILLFIVIIHIYLVCYLPTCIHFIINGAPLRSAYEITNIRKQVQQYNFSRRRNSFRSHRIVQPIVLLGYWFTG